MGSLTGTSAAPNGDSFPLDADAMRMARVARDEPGAFAELVSAYQNRVVGILYHMVGNSEDAEDLAQEVFLRVFRNRTRYRPTARFSTWIFTIANNLALNWHRDRKRRPRSAPAPAESAGVSQAPWEGMLAAPSGAMPSRIFAKGELAAIIREAVARLPAEQRMAIMLNKFEDMNYKQISEVMGRSEMAIKSLLSRGRANLRDMLAPYLESGVDPGATAKTEGEAKP